MQDRLKGRVSNHSDCKKIKDLPKVSLERERLYQFTCLPFGLRSSPRIFTKVLKPLLVYLRALGVRLLVYLDDITTTSISVRIGKFLSEQSRTQLVCIISTLVLSERHQILFHKIFNEGYHCYSDSVPIVLTLF